MNYLKRAYNLMIGERTAEDIKVKIGSVYPMEKETSMEVRGRDLVAGLPKTLTITSQEVREALLEPVQIILESVRLTLERCPLNFRAIWWSVGWCWRVEAHYCVDSIGF